MSTTRPPIVYITREIERALGMTPSHGYHIVTNRTSYGEKLHKQYPEYITLIEPTTEDLMGTGDLMKQPATIALMERLAKSSGMKPYVLVFKNTARIEPITREQGWTLLNPSEAVSEKIENKLSQITWLGDLVKYLPPHRVEYMKNVVWANKPFIVQWAHGHTGGGTILIESEQALKDLQAKFPERRCRITDYIDGPSFTVNVVASPEILMPSTVSYQITGLAPFTDAKFATVGNDWTLPKTLLTDTDRAWIKDLIAAVGAKMQKEHWRGLFGIDMIKDSKTGKMYFIEVNARQPASTTFESHLQESLHQNGASGLTTFEAHLAALLGEPLMKTIIEIKDASQIVQRVTKTVKSVPEDVAGGLELEGYIVTPYENTGENEDLLRIQSKGGIMAGHNEFNEAGKTIASALDLR